MKTLNIQPADKLFFVGIAGSGMSALAQYAAMAGYSVAGSDRQFRDMSLPIVGQFSELGISCHVQDASGLDEQTNYVVASTAIENTNPEIQKANALHIPIIHRSDLLAFFIARKKTIAVAGTSGKSTTTAMVFQILHHAGLEPSLISGAAIHFLQKNGKIGNAYHGVGEWLVVEADESDGSLVKYRPEIGLVLNIEKDHKKIEELVPLFRTFIENCQQKIILNFDDKLLHQFIDAQTITFSAQSQKSNYYTHAIMLQPFSSEFAVHNNTYKLAVPGMHNVQNAVAAIAAAKYIGVSTAQIQLALAQYSGIHRRHQLVEATENLILIDDYAHNPAKVEASIKACYTMAPQIIAWFQPHGFGPTRFLRHEFVAQIQKALRPTDHIYMSEIYYAGGTVARDISSADLINDLQAKGVSAHFVPNRTDFPKIVQHLLIKPTVILLMGARDNSLDSFATYCRNYFFQEK